MSTQVAAGQTTVGKRLLLAGDVQGYGIRPDIARLAKRLSLSGAVRNSNQGVEIEIQGPEADVDQFCLSVGALAPQASLRITALTAERLPRFEIEKSDTASVPNFELPLDRVTCADCLNEVFTPGDRRFGYALNTCTKCGPRFSIMRGTPYDRQRTSMADFPMCHECASEFLDPDHRRFHAQTNCCPACGPRIWFSAGENRIDNERPLELAAVAILEGKLLAVKGVGGYQLICDATNESAVRRLRNRKGRPSKPLAVMVQSVRDAKRLVAIDQVEKAALTSPVGPIVILQSGAGGQLAKSIHPGLNCIGLMLPTTAMHALLLKTVDRPLIVTSANREGEPIQFKEDLAPINLASIADCFLHHNRPIECALDDSVVRCMAGRVSTMRAGRGLAPMRLVLNSPSALATGGQQKNATAISNGKSSFLNAHIGDLDGLANRDRFTQQINHSNILFQTSPSSIVCDSHPDYFTNAWSLEHGRGPVVSIQHHHAHIAAGMVENGWLDREVLGFAFDGTGYGNDGTIWGGEVLMASLTGFQRIAHLRQFHLPGREQAIREPWRVAVALLVDAFGDDWFDVATSLKLDVTQMVSVAKLLHTLHAPATSSMGRLFDGVASIVLGLHSVDYEGEAAMKLEAACGTAAHGSYTFTLTEGRPIEIDWRPSIRSLVADLLLGECRTTVAMRFHQGVADCVADIAERFTELPVVLSGGVFQNRVLVELIANRTQRSDARIAFPGRIPVNDGGLAAGQLAIAAKQFEENRPCV